MTAFRNNGHGWERADIRFHFWERNVGPILDTFCSANLFGLNGGRGSQMKTAVQFLVSGTLVLAKRLASRALFLLCAILFTVSVASVADSAPALKIENNALADAVNAAQIAGKAGNYAEAIAKAREANALPNKPPQLGPILHRQILGWAIQAKDYVTAIAELDMMIAAGVGNREALVELREQLKSGLAPSKLPQLGTEPQIVSPPD
jgi:hypothetical protein